MKRKTQKQNPKTSRFGTIYVVIGTRAQMIKMAPIMARMQERHIPYRFIYTAQHRETIDELLKDFKVKQPDIILSDRKEANTMTNFFGWWGLMLSYLVRPRKVFPRRGFVLNHGDTATCAIMTVVAKLARCRTGHVESGLRSFNLFAPFPEEIMRLITFRFSDVNFCPNSWAVKNLRSYRSEKINTHANPLYDAVMMAVRSDAQPERFDRKYVVVSLHRYENVFKSRFSEVIIPLLENIAAKGFLLVFILHPATREILKRNGGVLYKRLQDNPNIVLRDRYRFFEFIKLYDKSEFVITDGGSNQEELSYLGKPTLLFRDVTERVEGLDRNIVVTKFDEARIMKFLSDYRAYAYPPEKYAVSPKDIIVDYLMKQ